MTDIREKLAKEQLFNTVADLLKPVIVRTLTEATQTCLTCDHWQSVKEVCAFHNFMRPPARIIAFGCSDYINEIPF